MYQLCLLLNLKRIDPTGKKSESDSDEELPEYLRNKEEASGDESEESEEEEEEEDEYLDEEFEK